MTEHPHRLRLWHIALLCAPAAGLLFPGLYARNEPTLWGIPFFYTYQFAWIALSALLTAVVYRCTRKED